MTLKYSQLLTHQRRLLITDEIPSDHPLDDVREVGCHDICCQS